MVEGTQAHSGKRARERLAPPAPSAALTWPWKPYAPILPASVPSQYCASRSSLRTWHSFFSKVQSQLASTMRTHSGARSLRLTSSCTSMEHGSRSVTRKGRVPQRAPLGGRCRNAHHWAGGAATRTIGRVARGRNQIRFPAALSGARWCRYDPMAATHWRPATARMACGSCSSTVLATPFRPFRVHVTSARVGRRNMPGCAALQALPVPLLRNSPG